MKAWLPRFGIFECTTGAADDRDATGPDYEGRTICVSWMRWTVEFTLAHQRL